MGLIDFKIINEGKAVDVVFLDFNNSFNTEAHGILLEKRSCGMSGFLFWVEN